MNIATIMPNAKIGNRTKANSLSNAMFMSKASSFIPVSKLSTWGLGDCPALRRSEGDSPRYVGLVGFDSSIGLFSDLWEDLW